MSENKIENSENNQGYKSGLSVNDMRPILESLLFISGKPVKYEKLKKILNTRLNYIKDCVAELNTEYNRNNHGFKIIDVAGGYQLATKDKYSPYIKKLFGVRKIKRLTPAALEVLAIIAYKQPLSKSEIEYVRGVNSDSLVGVLLENKMIKIVGRSEEIGRALLYGTTEDFLEYFGLKSLTDLPDKTELEQILSDKVDEQRESVDRIMDEKEGVSKEDSDENEIDENLISENNSEKNDTINKIKERIARDKNEEELEKELDKEFSDALVSGKKIGKTVKEVIEVFKDETQDSDSLNEFIELKSTEKKPDSNSAATVQKTEDTNDNLNENDNNEDNSETIETDIVNNELSESNLLSKEKNENI